MSEISIQNFITGDSSQLNRLEIQSITQKVDQLIKLSTGRIHLHIEKNASLRVLDRASEIFDMLFLGENDDVPTVLIYICLNNRQFAIICGQALDKLLPPNAWTETIENMTIYFKNKELVKAILEGMESAGKILQSKFPIQ